MATRQVLDDTWCRVVRWQHPVLRVYAIRAEGLVFESLPLAAHGALVPPLIGHQLTIVLRGELLSRRGDREHAVRPGLGLVEPTMTWNERWMGASFEALLVDWAPQLLPVAATRTLVVSAREAAEASALVERIFRPGDEREAAAEVVGGASRLVERLGLGRFEPDPTSDAPLFASSELARATARWVSAIRSDVRTAGWKRAEDLAGASERQLRRHYALLAEEAGLSPSLRAVLLHDRLTAAVRLLGGHASIAHVAQASGYGSSRALGLALDQAEMPTATEIRRLARADG